ncbi:MAG: hypothetical protein L6Q57_08510 [Alphaproteobacteria bacterium]|nr:hypothetical protein [Alphaproteobacteria bacterium]
MTASITADFTRGAQVKRDTEYGTSVIRIAVPSDPIPQTGFECADVTKFDLSELKNPDDPFSRQFIKVAERVSADKARQWLERGGEYTAHTTTSPQLAAAA